MTKNILDLNPIFKGDKTKIEFSFEFLPECIDKTIKFNIPASVSGRAYEKASASHGCESLVMLEINVFGKYDTICARCLHEISVPYEIKSEYAVALTLQSEEEEEILRADGGMLDIGEVADALFFMNLPAKHLCSNDCKGLCQCCGTNLNFDKCTCNKKNIDPRLEVLKKLLDK